METTDKFTQSALEWFDEGESIETRVEEAPYEPFTRIPLRTKLATAAASVAALGTVLWLLA